MGKTQEIKSLRPTLPQSLPLGSGSRAKLDQAGFLRMQRKAEMLQAFPKVSQEAFRLSAMLKPQNEIVSVADNDHIAASMATAPLVCPQVQDVVQVHVAKQRRYYRSLRRAYPRRGPNCRPRRLRL